MKRDARPRALLANWFPSFPSRSDYPLLLQTCETPIRTEVFIRSLTGINYVLPPAFVFPCDEGLSLVLPEAAALRGR